MALDNQTDKAALI